MMFLLIKEETGFTSDNWKYMGFVEPNPAFHQNLCHHWLALDAEKTCETDLDSGEDIVVDTLSLEEIRAEIKEGSLRHSLCLIALSKVCNIWKNEHNPDCRPQSEYSFSLS